MKQTLNYVRVAKAAKDGYDGFLYIHHWPTGWQELVFATHELAQKFIDNLNSSKNETPTPKP